MKTVLRALVLTFSLAGFAASLSACHTVKGAGKDIEKAGEEIQKASDDVRK